MARMKKQNEKHVKMNKLAKLKTWKGGLGKNEHPAGLATYKGNSGKNRGNENNLFPGGPKTRKGDPGKNGMKKKHKQMKAYMQKALITDAIFKARSVVKHPAMTVPSKRLFPTSLWIEYSSLSSAMVSMRLLTTAPPKGDFHKHMLEHEPLRAQYFNVLSISVKLCLQIANHHAFQAFIRA